MVIQKPTQGMPREYSVEMQLGQRSAWLNGAIHGLGSQRASKYENLNVRCKIKPPRTLYFFIAIPSEIPRSLLSEIWLVCLEKRGAEIGERAMCVSKPLGQDSVRLACPVRTPDLQTRVHLAQCCNAYPLSRMSDVWRWLR